MIIDTCLCIQSNDFFSLDCVIDLGFFHVSTVAAVMIGRVARSKEAAY